MFLGTIRARLRLAAAGIAIILVAAATVGLLTVQQLSRDIQRGETDAVGVQDLTNRFAVDVVDELRAGEQYLHAPTAPSALLFRERGRDAHRVQAMLVRSQLARAVRDSTADAELLARIDAELSELESVYAGAHRLVDVGAGAEGIAVVARAATLESRLRGDVSLLAKNQTVRVTEFGTSVRRAAIAQSVVLVALLLVAIGIVAGLTWQLGRSIARPLATLVSHANALQRGSRDTQTSDEGLPGEFRTLAHAMNQATESLASLARTEAALHQSEKLAAIGTLISGVAHELNNPLQTILLTSELTKATTTDRSTATEMAQIAEQVLRARTIISDLLKTVRTDNVVRDAAPLETTFRGIERELSAIAARYGASLETTVNGMLPPLLVERVGFAQVLTNLVGNAGAAAGEGGRIRVTAQRCDGGCEILVDDSGPGIPPELLGRIFEPFFSTKSVGNGTGLGLSVSRGIVEAMNGTLTAKSHWGAPQTGARVRVFLPIGGQGSNGGTVLSRATTVNRPPARSTPVPPPPDHVPVCRMLIVDDESAIQLGLGRLFALRGWRVDGASSGAEALTHIKQRTGNGTPYAVVLCDLRMPVMSGVELHDLLVREHPEVIERMVFLSGDLISEDMQSFVDRTTCRVLCKPVDIKELDTVVAAMARAAGAAVTQSQNGSWRVSA
jgi:signal transduction histidine kinase/ActR/RegA family two-component response regulator